jgi:hypothetical protein
VTEKWTVDNYATLTTSEIERLQVILDRKLNEVATMYEHRVFSSTYESKKQKQEA